jgi:hypothetical protein
MVDMVEPGLITGPTSQKEIITLRSASFKELGGHISSVLLCLSAQK